MKKIQKKKVSRKAAKSYHGEEIVVEDKDRKGQERTQSRGMFSEKERTQKRMHHAKDHIKSQIRQRRFFRKTMTNILKDPSNYLKVETQYFASQKSFIFRGAIHADADISATNDESARGGLSE